MLILARGGMAYFGPPTKILDHFASPPLGFVYLSGIAGVIGLLAYQHWLVRPDDLRRVNLAFFYVNGVISVGMLMLVLVQLAVKW